MFTCALEVAFPYASARICIITVLSSAPIYMSKMTLLQSMACPCSLGNIQLNIWLVGIQTEWLQRKIGMLPLILRIGWDTSRLRLIVEGAIYGRWPPINFRIINSKDISLTVNLSAVLLHLALLWLCCVWYFLETFAVYNQAVNPDKFMQYSYTYMCIAKIEVSRLSLTSIQLLLY